MLTFDDGPDNDATPAVLDALDTVDVRATFFLLGSHVDAEPGLAREIVARGHEVGVHGYNHPRHERISVTESRDDVMRGYDAISSALDIRCAWYRPPYGKMSDGAAEACRELGMTTVYWSAWGLDWEPVSSERIADVACQRLTAGGILLLHDSAGLARRPSARPTADAVPIIAGRVAERGIKLMRLDHAVIKTAPGVET